VWCPSEFVGDFETVLEDQALAVRFYSPHIPLIFLVPSGRLIPSSVSVGAISANSSGACGLHWVFPAWRTVVDVAAEGSE